MAQKTQIIDLTKSYLPIDPAAFVQSLVNTDREDGEEKTLPCVAYEGYNFLPTPYGYMSFFGTNAQLAINALTSRAQWILLFQTATYKNRLIALCEDGIWIALADGQDVRWRHEVVFKLAADASPGDLIYDPTIFEEWTWCIIENTLYMYQQARPNAWKTGSGTVVVPDAPGYPGYSLVGDVTIVTHTPTFLNMAGQMGIFKAGTRLAFWDSANSVGWSSNLDLTDFTPSIENMAGNSIFSDVKGRIISCRQHGEGFIIYSTKSVTGANFSQQGNLLWDSKPILASAGISYARAVAFGQSDSEHFVWTTSGIVKIGKYTSITGKHEIEWILPELYDLMKESRDPIYLETIEDRYLAFCVVNDIYLSKAPSFVEVSVPTVVAPAITLDNTFFTVNDGGVVDGDEAYQIVYNFLSNPTGALVQRDSNNTETPYELARWMFAYSGAPDLFETPPADGEIPTDRVEFAKLTKIFGGTYSAAAINSGDIFSPNSFWNTLHETHAIAAGPFNAAKVDTGKYQGTGLNLAYELWNDVVTLGFAAGTLGVYCSNNTNLTPYTNTSGPKSAFDLLLAYIKYVRQCNYFVGRDKESAIANLVASGKSIVYKSLSPTIESSFSYFSVPSNSLDVSFDINRTTRRMDVYATGETSRRHLLTRNATNVIATQTNGVAGKGLRLFLTSDPYTNTWPHYQTFYTTPTVAGVPLSVSPWPGGLYLDGIETAQDLYDFFDANPLKEVDSGYTWTLNRNPAVGMSVPGSINTAYYGSLVQLHFECAQRPEVNYIAGWVFLRLSPDDVDYTGAVNIRELSVNQIDYNVLMQDPRNINLALDTVDAYVHAPCLAYYEYAWLMYLKHLNNTGADINTYYGRDEGRVITPILGEVSFEFEGDLLYVVNGANGRIQVCTYLKEYEVSADLVYTDAVALVAKGTPEYTCGMASFQLEAIDTVKEISETELEITATTQIRPSVLNGTNYDLAIFNWDFENNTPLPYSYAARTTECSRSHIYDSASSTLGIHSADFTDVHDGTVNGMDMVTSPDLTIANTLLCPMDSLGSGPWTVTVPIDFTYPSSTFLLQTGSIDPGYITFAGAYVLDIQLQKWGKFVSNFKNLIPMSSINIGGTTFSHQKLGMDLAIMQSTGRIKLFDSLPQDSWIRYGKLGLYRQGMTNIVEVKTQQRRPLNCTLTVDTSMDGKTIDSTLSISETFTGLYLNSMNVDRSGRWHTVKISGNYDLTGLEFRATIAGRR